MGEFTKIAEAMRPIFGELEEVKKEYGITSLVIENLHTIDQFTVSFARKGSYTGRRERKYIEDTDKPFLQIR